MTHFFPIQPQCLRVPQDQKSLQPTFLLLLILIFVSVKIFVKKKSEGLFIFSYTHLEGL